MNSPEPVENVHESFGETTFDVDNGLSHAVLSEPLVRNGVLVEVLVPAGEKVEYDHIDYFDGEWILHLRYNENHYQLPLSEQDVEWVYDSEVPQKAERAEELLEEAQGLLDDIWGETGDTSAEELTKRVNQTRSKLKRNYDM